MLHVGPSEGSVFVVALRPAAGAGLPAAQARLGYRRERLVPAGIGISVLSRWLRRLS